MSPPVFTLDQVIAQLRTSWGGASENNTYPFATSPILYAILTSPPADSSPENAGWVAMSALMAARAAEAFELWDDLIPVSLNPYAGNPPANANIIQFGYSSATDGGGTYEYPVLSTPPTTANQYGGQQFNIVRAEIWLNSTWSTHNFSSAINQPGFGYYGGYGFITYLHEIGHALGLSHPGSYNAGGSDPITYASNAEFAQDTRRYTVMSYFDANDDGSGADHVGSDNLLHYAQTPMLYDIAAVQAIYGADFTTRSTDTTYGFHNNTGLNVYDFTKNTNPILTIWDGGGIDTLDLSGFSGTQRVDLNAGTYSDVGGFMTNNLAIAYNVTIENAVGGSGNDTITGNDANNTLWGGPGNDTLVGAIGNDILHGGPGNDVLNGGPGADQFVFDAPSDGGDTVQDFAFGTDHLVLNHIGFGLAGTGTLQNAGVSFVNGGSATSLSPTIFFNGTDAFWDSDGTGSSPSSLLAHFSNSGLTHSSVTDGFVSGWNLLSVGHFDTSVNNDMVWQRASDGYTLTWMMSNGAVTTAHLIGTMPGWDVVATGDFNGDGVDDLVWQRESDGSIEATVMSNGSVDHVVDLGAAPGWKVIATGDFNGDGTSDLIWQRDSDGFTLTALMSNGAVASARFLGMLQGWNVTATGDYNGDGTDDIILQRDYDGFTQTALMSDGAVASARFLGMLQGWNIVASGHFNGDGSDDLVLQRLFDGFTQTGLMSNGAIVSASFDGMMPGWKVIAAGDYNNDSIDDVLWQRPSDGSTNAWLMSNGVVANAVDLGALPGWTMLSSGQLDQGGPDDLMWTRSDGWVESWLLHSPQMTAQDWLVI